MGNGSFSGFHGVALPSTVSRSNWNLEMLVFVEGGKPEYPGKKASEQGQEHMTPRPGIEPRPHWWEANALTTAPSLLHSLSYLGN